MGVRRILNLLPTELKQSNHKNLLYQPNCMNKKTVEPIFIQQHCFFWTRINQASMLTKERMHGLEALAKIELKPHFHQQSNSIHPTKQIFMRGEYQHTARQSTCDDITLSSLLLIQHSSKRHNNMNKEKRRTNNLPNHK